MGIFKRKKKIVKKKWGDIQVKVCDSGFEVQARDYSNYNPRKGAESYTWAVTSWVEAILKLNELKDEGLRIET